VANLNRVDFPVAIQRKTVGVTERGFGTILIFDTTEDRDFEYLTIDSIPTMTIDSTAYKIASTLFMQKPRPQEVAIIGKVAGEDETVGDKFQEVLAEVADKFFWLVTTDDTAETIKELSTACQVANKVYGVTVHDVDEAKALYEEVFDNTFVAYHDDPNAYLAEGLAVIMSYKIGGKTAKFKTVQGIKECKIDYTLEKEMAEHEIFTYIDKLGVLSVSDGKMLSGEWIDVVLGEYWIRWRMEEALQRLAYVEDKIPYDDIGIGMLVGQCNAVLNRAVRQGILIKDQYRVDHLPRRDVPSNEVALRRYDYIYWEATLSGAIHSGTINGVLTYDMVVEEDN
jgi:hypothetical protein